MSDSGASRSIQLAYIFALTGSAGWCLLALGGVDKHPSFFVMLTLPIVATVQLLRSARWVGAEIHAHHRPLVWSMSIALITIFVFIMWGFLITAGRPVQGSTWAIAALSGVFFILSVVLALRHGYRQVDDVDQGSQLHR
jgi:hypothetical protein